MGRRVVCGREGRRWEESRRWVEVQDVDRRAGITKRMSRNEKKDSKEQD